MKEDTRLNVVVLHDDPLVAAGLQAVLERRADVRLVRSGASEPTADLALADYASAMSLVGADVSGRRVHGLGTSGDATRVLIISTRSSEQEIRHAMRAGIHGYVVQGGELAELMSAIGALSRGGKYVGGLAAQRLADGYCASELTQREHEVLHELAAGRCNKRIAAQLNIELGTVKAHLRAIFQKLGADNRTHAASVAGRRGLLAIDSRAASTRAPREAAPGNTRSPVTATRRPRSPQTVHD